MALGSLRAPGAVFFGSCGWEQCSARFQLKIQISVCSIFIYIYSFFFFFVPSAVWGHDLGERRRVCRVFRNLLVTPSNSGGVRRRYLWQGRLRRQGGFRDPGKNAMPAADLHASTGSLHIIKARGCLQWLHLRPSPHRRHRGGPTHWFIFSCLCECLLPLPRERAGRERGSEGGWGRDGSETRFTHVWDEIHFWGEKAWNSSDREEPTFLLASRIAPPCLPSRSRWWMFMRTLSPNRPQSRRHRRHRRRPPSPSSSSRLFLAAQSAPFCGPF